MSELTNVNFKEAVQMWIENKTKCTCEYGDISKWNTVNITNMDNIFSNSTFNNDISNMFYETIFNTNLNNFYL
jgi:hypothetical protein